MEENRAQSPKGDAAHGTYLSKHCRGNSVNKFIKLSPALGCSVNGWEAGSALCQLSWKNDRMKGVQEEGTAGSHVPLKYHL